MGRLSCDDPFPSGALKRKLLANFSCDSGEFSATVVKHMCRLIFISSITVCISVMLVLVLFVFFISCIVISITIIHSSSSSSSSFTERKITETHKTA